MDKTTVTTHLDGLDQLVKHWGEKHANEKVLDWCWTTNDMLRVCAKLEGRNAALYENKDALTILYKMDPTIYMIGDSPVTLDCDIQIPITREEEPAVRAFLKIKSIEAVSGLL